MSGCRDSIVRNYGRKWRIKSCCEIKKTLLEIDRTLLSNTPLQADRLAAELVHARFHALLDVAHFREGRQSHDGGQVAYLADETSRL